MIKLHDGMETLPKYLAEYLINNTNTKIKYNTSIQDIDAVTGKSMVNHMIISDPLLIPMT